MRFLYNRVMEPTLLPKEPEKLLTPAPAVRSTSWGALIGIVIILIVLVVGALYFWGAHLVGKGAIEAPTPSFNLGETPTPS